MGHPWPMAAERPLLLVFGSGDDADRVSQNGIRTYVRGSSDLGRLLPNRDMLHRVIVTPDSTHDFSGYPVIVNMITEAENSAKVLANLEKQLNGTQARVINPPAKVMRTTRDQVAKLLDGIPGLIAPKSVRLSGDQPAEASDAISAAGIVPPFILREAGTHTGQTAVVHSSIDEAVARLENGKEYIATQFVDFVSDDGIYRKCRVFFIGRHAVLRHVYASDHWNVHSADRTRFMAPRPDIVAAERALIGKPRPFSPEVHEVLEAVRARMPLDFFGIDFSILPSGEVVLFEANATMSFFPLWRDESPLFRYMLACVPPAQAAFMELVSQRR